MPPTAILLLAVATLGLPSKSSADKFKPISVDYKKGIELAKNSTCDIQLSFGSYGGGICMRTHKKVEKFLSSYDGLAKSYEWTGGFEGDLDWCLVLKDKTKTGELFDKLKGLNPEFSRHGSTELKAKDGKKWASTWPKEETQKSGN